MNIETFYTITSFTSSNPITIVNVNNSANQITVTAAVNPDCLHSFLGLCLLHQIEI